MTEPTVYAGIDLGGTAIKLAFVTGSGKILWKTQEPTRVTAGEDGILQQMKKLMDQGLQSLPYSLEMKQLQGLGIGVPAFLDVEKGFVKKATNLGWTQYPLKERLQSMTGLPVFVDNDANTAALGEMWRGAGKGARNMFCLTLGTGVGGGIIIDRQIYHGAQGVAGEIGHVTVEREGGFLCNCGKSGCLETIASARGIVRVVMRALQEQDRQAQHGQETDEQKRRQLLVHAQNHTPSILMTVHEQKGKLEARDIAQAAVAGDALAQNIMHKVGHDLGWVLGNYALLFNPEKIVIGGGVSQAGDVLFAPIRQAYQTYALPHLTGQVHIAPATLGNDAGVIGAAWLVHTKQT